MVVDVKGDAQESARRPMPAVVYAPHVLRSMAEICEALGVGPKTVKAWVGKGAPIAVEGEGAKVRYSAEMTRLQVWRES